MSPYQVIRGPLITEKSERQARSGADAFASACIRSATKTDIKNAVQQRFQGQGRRRSARRAYVGKLRRRGRFAGYRPDWKKAYVKLKDGERMVEYAQI